MEMISNWFSSEGFMPHGHCFLWIPSILWTSVISDALIALSYLSIPISLIYFIRKRRDMPFDWMFIAFGVFILPAAPPTWPISGWCGSPTMCCR
jgi:hypothetical protein